MERPRFADKLWDRNRHKIVAIISRLRFKLNYYALEIDSILNYVHFKFLDLCYDVYENDEQFMRFMFVVTRNIVYDLRRKDVKYLKQHNGDLLKLRSKFMITCNDIGAEDSYLRIMNEIAVDETPVDSALIHEELIKAVESHLENPVHIKIFQLLLQSYKPQDISEEIGRPVAYVGQIKRQFIYPAVAEVLELSEEEYEYHAASGRIYTSA